MMEQHTQSPKDSTERFCRVKAGLRARPVVMHVQHTSQREYGCVSFVNILQVVTIFFYCNSLFYSRTF